MFFFCMSKVIMKLPAMLGADAARYSQERRQLLRMMILEEFTQWPSYDCSCDTLSSSSPIRSVERICCDSDFLNLCASYEFLHALHVGQCSPTSILKLSSSSCYLLQICITQHVHLHICSTSSADFLTAFHTFRLTQASVAVRLNVEQLVHTII